MSEMQEVITINSFDICFPGDSSVGMADKVITWTLPEPIDGYKFEIEDVCDSLCYFLAELYNCQPYEFKVTTSELQRLQVEAESKVNEVNL